MSKTTTVLELTTREAQSLAALAMNGVLWSSSGTFGQDIQAIYNALDAIDVEQSNFRSEESISPAKWVKFV